MPSLFFFPRGNLKVYGQLHPQGKKLHGVLHLCMFASLLGFLNGFIIAVGIGIQIFSKIQNYFILCHILVLCYVIFAYFYYTTHTQLPDVQRMARNISRVIETGVESEVKRGRAALERVSSDVQRAVGSTLPTLKQHLRSAGKKAKKNPFSCSLLKKRDRKRGKSLYTRKKEARMLPLLSSCHAIVG